MSNEPPEYSVADFAAEFDVPRGTMLALQTYAELLSEWQRKMNLIGPATLPNMWSRHFRDSAQLVRFGRGAAGRKWLDIGSGAGFPALVVALLTDADVHLVEATTKKCNFLRQVIADGQIRNATVHNDRIEAVPRFAAEIISARACAPLTQLFAWGSRFGNKSTRWLLPKGARHAEEISDARRLWRFKATLHPSLTDPDARVIEAYVDLGEGG